MERALADLRYSSSSHPVPVAISKDVQAYMGEYIESISPMLRKISLQLCSESCRMGKVACTDFRFFHVIEDPELGYDEK